ncbi:MAG TPA: thiamine pyrophosphate-dependent dehydrogenase E1 component subunit alpha, partial [Steroidobacteraceae bacterium]|nr:thiamine pyrophosphate-dependent dehydrogenase E1 component subunit alpha [Steroidobacteraceae bacterium]
MTTANATVARDTQLRIYELMVRIAEADRAIQRGLAAGELQFQYYPCGGQEAIPAAIAQHLKPDDKMVTTYRGIHDIVAKGTPLTEIMAEMHGRVTGTSKGKGGPMHLSDPNSGMMVTTGIVGAGLPIANGIALAEQLRGTGRVTVVSFGDGATSIGAFHEALNLAAAWDLPVVFVCQNNQYAEYTAIAEYTKTRDFSQRAAAYSMRGIRVDGTDPLAVYEAAAEAIDHARSGKGPVLLEAVCHRLQGHAFGSDEAHMDKAALAEARKAAPVPRFRARLIADQLATEDDLTAIEARVRSEVDAAMKFARESPQPGPEELYVDVFADPSLVPDHERGKVAAEEPQAPGADVRN